MRIPTSLVVSFHRILTDYYYEFGRHDMAWRKPGENGAFDPYRIFISEMMLQQTQVDRVMPKYKEFLERFPSVQTLAASSISDVLTAWSGLGYNRRAKYVWEAANMIHIEYQDQFPATQQELQAIPGIGPNTAGAIVAYAYNEPVVFVETNIRTVIIHHFFTDKKDVPDTDILEVLSHVVPQKQDMAIMRLQGAILGPREFYWAMMDYGTYLKKTIGNVGRASRHYTKQSVFKGSKREIRGQVIRLLTKEHLEEADLYKVIPDPRLEEVITELLSEGMIARTGDVLSLAGAGPQAAPPSSPEVKKHIREHVIDLLLDKHMTKKELHERVLSSDLDAVLKDMIAEGVVIAEFDKLRLR